MAMLFQKAKALGGRGSHTVVQLVEFVQQARVGFLCLKCPFITLQRSSRISPHVEPSDSQIPPWNCEIGIAFARTFPKLHCLFAPLLVIQQVAEIVRSFGIRSI